MVKYISNIKANAISNAHYEIKNGRSPSHRVYSLVQSHSPAQYRQAGASQVISGSLLSYDRNTKKVVSGLSTVPNGAVQVIK